MALQLFAQAGQSGGVSSVANNNIPAGFNLSALTGMSTGAQNTGALPSMIGGNSFPQQYASLAGAFGAAPLQPQALSVGVQPMFNPMGGLSSPMMQDMNAAFQGLKQENDPLSSTKPSMEIEWTEPFAGKGKKEPPFPLKLHQILSNPEFSECICWNAHGRSWRILKPPVFEQGVIPLYFRCVKTKFL